MAPVPAITITPPTSATATSFTDTPFSTSTDGPAGDLPPLKLQTRLHCAELAYYDRPTKRTNYAMVTACIGASVCLAVLCFFQLYCFRRAQ